MQITTIGLDLAKHWFQVHGESERRPNRPPDGAASVRDIRRYV